MAEHDFARFGVGKTTKKCGARNGDKNAARPKQLENAEQVKSLFYDSLFESGSKSTKSAQKMIAEMDGTEASFYNMSSPPGGHIVTLGAKLITGFCSCSIICVSLMRQLS
jgi:hypothetical protein